ncbi:ATPase components of various ABC-type transport systems [Vibrio sp. JCM 19236]|nr:ATPase components of various ABC-type transport systems [Vibrio sp. JCM 19236]
MAKELGGQVLVMKKGQILERGDCDSVLRTPRSDYAKALISASHLEYQNEECSVNARPLLELNKIEKSRGGVTLFSGLDLKLNQGRC